MRQSMATVHDCLAFNAAEHPVALQLGGSDAAKVAEAARIGESSAMTRSISTADVHPIAFSRAHLVRASCTHPTRGVLCGGNEGRSCIPVTVKCRIGVDDQDTEVALNDLADSVFAEGADALWVHARKAWLEGLSPRENRDIPPLDYERVYRLKQRLPEKFIGINGGIQTVEEGGEHLRHVDGVMLAVQLITRRQCWMVPMRCSGKARRRPISPRCSKPWPPMWTITSREVDACPILRAIWLACFMAGPAPAASARSYPRMPTSRARN